MMSVKDSACSQVALRVRGDTGQSKGGAQKSVDAVHSQPNTPDSEEEWCACRESNPGRSLGRAVSSPLDYRRGGEACTSRVNLSVSIGRSVEGCVMVDKARSHGRSVEGSSHVEVERAIMDGQWKGELC